MRLSDIKVGEIYAVRRGSSMRRLKVARLESGKVYLTFPGADHTVSGALSVCRCDPRDVVRTWEQQAEIKRQAKHVAPMVRDFLAEQGLNQDGEARVTAGSNDGLVSVRLGAEQMMELLSMAQRGAEAEQQVDPLDILDKA